MFEDDGHSCSIEEMDSFPIEVNLDLVFNVGNFDQPEQLRLEIPDPVVAIDDKAESRELAGA